ncbi:extracellular solute-binding protein [Paenibacillus dendritiformis]|uniref:ABC transporter substrate-binding protein n=1 Tax=Paenibacillus dendritiformis TaxID=130049 RepID=UPI00143D5E81|nr:extracellular solute-binding protein [Paenibacillus dendritiformis]NKI23496.1 extracellular solute-binding protein [Paenibacillus dendritiformis]NRG01093.1 extracellular solute-binding protein [Paenibacillus dendritiformis]
MKRNLSLLSIAILLMMLLGSGCGGTTADPPALPLDQRQDGTPRSAPEQTGGSDTAQPNDASAANEVAYDGEAVTLKFIIEVDEETFRIRYKEQIEEKFPNITLELANASLTPEGLQELNARGEIPDLYVMHQGYDMLKELDMLEPLDPYIEQSGFDLGVINDGIAEIQRALDPDGTGLLYGMPIEGTQRALYYNKAIFDKFGVGYPRDGMTWDEILDLAKQVTAERDGVKYKGLSFGHYSIPLTQFGVNGTDPETGEVLFTKEPAFQQFFAMLDKYRSIPGMVDTSDYSYTFNNDQNVAMTIVSLPTLPLYNAVQGLDFDMVSVPVWPHHPAIGPSVPAISVSINKHSPHKDAAWAVIAHLASEDGQLVLSRVGSPPTIKSAEAFEQYSAADMEAAGKKYNIRPIFEQKMASISNFSPYGPLVTFFYDDYINQKARAFVTEPDKDVATFLREMEEEYAAIVKEMKQLK